MYNCAQQIGRVLKQLENPDVAKFFHGVLCVDNQSPDATLEVAAAAMERVPLPFRAILRNAGNYGLGGSHKVAIDFGLAQGYSHLVVLHGDDQGSIADLTPLVAAGAHDSLDCLLGARFMPGSRLQGYSALRTLANRVFNAIFSIISGQKLYDLGSGLNLYRLDIFRDGFHRRFRDDLTFNYFLILACCQKGFRQKFFPLTWCEDDQISNAKLFRQGVRMLKLLAQRIFDPKGFLASEHRAVAIADYSSQTVRAWPGA
ncbi:dolichyl-phosphate mannose synthase [Rhodoblastus sphagnicola]|uniref:Dolichyl-phosphate mannose synthase n=2 Tax=Rhodoblastus sphagnicola TaxID=333368 RepID=A0A2S6MXC7_9HYPH|nr:dolichyl-phosphate mannose synthase [Rhodoblastus sphagnicola]